jgi:hypothetical protein
MKVLRDYQVSKGKIEGRVRLALKAVDGTLQLWLSPEQAERLAADILSVRFDLPTLEVVAPPKPGPKPGPKSKRRPRRFIVFTSEPRILGTRPELSEQLLDTIEQSKIPGLRDPQIRAKLEKAKEQWDRRWERTKAGKRAKQASEQSRTS